MHSMWLTVLELWIERCGNLQIFDHTLDVLSCVFQNPGAADGNTQKESQFNAMLSPLEMKKSSNYDSSGWQ